MLGFPCNQFGDQENCENAEILNALQHVRPGKGFVPLATIFEKVRKCSNLGAGVNIDPQVDVNGNEENPIFTFLKSNLPNPSDSKVAKLIFLDDN